MQKVVGSNPISRFARRPRYGGVFCFCWARLGGVANLLDDRISAHYCPIGCSHETVEGVPVGVPGADDLGVYGQPAASPVLHATEHFRASCVCAKSGKPHTPSSYLSDTPTRRSLRARFRSACEAKAQLGSKPAVRQSFDVQSGFRLIASRCMALQAHLRGWRSAMTLREFRLGQPLHPHSDSFAPGWAEATLCASLTGFSGRRRASSRARKRCRRPAARRRLRDPTPRLEPDQAIAVCDKRSGSRREGCAARTDAANGRRAARLRVRRRGR
jgi:hypothetical protein